MAARSFVVLSPATFLLFLQLATALQVSPNSPCSSSCLDAPSLDKSDPDSSNTTPKDITCSDGDFGSKPEGKKFQRCLACLQDSSYSWGDESDQQWFFYNLRYAFDYCILGYPNSRDLASSPCVTPEACGTLQKPLEDGLLDPAYAEPYDFCEVDGSKVLTDKLDTCISCVRATDSHTYLGNFLTAIQAGCEQKPAAGIIVGLSDTVFTTDTIDIAEPSHSSAASGSHGLSLSPPIIAAIAIGSLVFLLLAAGCTYMQVRKRRNRRARLRRASPLSFRCQTHVTPRTPEFPREQVTEKPCLDPAAALGSNPVVMSPGSDKLASITTSVHAPRPVHSGYPSPESRHATPTSTTSTRSNAPLLNSYKPYKPSDYHGDQTSSIPGLAISTSEESPCINQQGLQNQRQSPHSDQQGPYVLTKESLWERPAARNPTRDLRIARNSPVTGSPVAMTSTQTSFPAPPTSRR